MSLLTRTCGGRGEAAEGRRVTGVAWLAATVFLVCAAYYAGGLVGIRLRFPPSGIGTIWPPTAILLGALLLAPTRTWWVYLFAAVPTHLHLVVNFQPEVPLVVMFCQVGSNVAHAVLAALAVRGTDGPPPRFDSLRRVTLYILHAAIAATAVACALAAFLFVLTGWATDFWLAFRQRVLANVFTITTIPPLIVLAAAGELVGLRTPRRPRYAELGLLTLGLLAVSVLVFGWEAPASVNMPALLLAPLPLLLWSAVRLGPGGLCVCLLVVAGMSLSNAFAGRGPFVTRSPAENTLSLQIFLLAISIPLMILAGLVEERQRAEQEARRAEAEARRQREELAHVLRVATLGELTAALAHEINQPLTAIVTNAQAARRLLGSAPAEPAPVQDALADIAEEAMHASEVIRRLRVLFRKEHEERVTVDINALIEDVIGLLRLDAERRRIMVHFARGEALPPVLGEPVQLRQVVMNVVLNACEALDAIEVGRRTILIQSAQPDPEHLAIVVRDSGIGVKESELERIFEHFVSSKPQGLGMGLAISRSIVQAHGGRIWATANADMGLTVHVELPVGADQVVK
jgi:signal transduction histidine kinase